MPQDFHFQKFYENSLEFPKTETSLNFYVLVFILIIIWLVLLKYYSLKATGHSPKMYDVYSSVPCLITAGKDP